MVIVPIVRAPKASCSEGLRPAGRRPATSMSRCSASLWCFDSGWYVQIAAPNNHAVQIGIVSRSHDSVPMAFRHRPAGVLISLEVDDVDAIHARVIALGLRVPFRCVTRRSVSVIS